MRFAACAALAAAALSCAPPADQAGHATLQRTAHWSYEGEDGPARWAELSPDYAACAGGRHQSPIDLADAEFIAGPAALMEYQPASLRAARNEHAVDLVDNGHTIQFTYDEGSTLHLEGTDYELLQFHIHVPSEHTVEGRRFPMEVHLVHQSASGEFAVVGVVIEEGESDPGVYPLVENLPATPGASVRLENVRVDIDELLPLDPRYYRYEGSLTTPPCNEGVHWLVMFEPAELTPEHIERFRVLLEGTNRPLQSKHGRRIVVQAGVEPDS